MKIEKVSSWAELLASIAVVVTLVVLGFEVRSTNVALERQAAMDRAAALTAPGGLRYSSSASGRLPPHPAHE